MSLKPQVIVVSERQLESLTGAIELTEISFVLARLSHDETPGVVRK